MAKHIAFLTIPAAGHLNPTLPVVAELVRRGHRVTYATGAAFAGAVEAAGAEFVELDWTPKAIKVARTGQTTEDLARMLLTFVNSARRVTPAIEKWLVDDRPDLFVYDMMTFIGPALAAKLDLLEATTVANFAGNEHFNLTSALVPADFDPGHPKFQEFLAARAQYAKDFEVPLETVATAGAIAPMNLVFIPREFQLSGETFDERFHFAGPAIGARTAVSDWTSPGSPLLFISLGTAVNDRPDFFTTCAKAFGGTDWKVAMAIGTEVDLADLGEIPPNFDVRPYFPQPVVLEHADAFLSHAGMNSVMESLLNQVPLATYPQTAEQSANADRVEELGLGRRLPNDVTPDLLRATVDEIAADAGIRTNLAAMAEHISAAGGAIGAADALESYLVQSRCADSTGRSAG
jgi:MGT family glycosyltransferase